MTPWDVVGLAACLWLGAAGSFCVWRKLEQKIYRTTHEHDIINLELDNNIYQLDSSRKRNKNENFKTRTQGTHQRTDGYP